MNPKQQLLDEIWQALSTGEIQPNELRELLHDPAPASANTLQSPLATAPAGTPANSDDTTKTVEPVKKLSAVGIMFYISGLVLSIAIMSMIGQSWRANGSLQHVLMSAGVGSMLWLIAHILHKQPVKSDIREGLINALVLTGSLCLITGLFIITNMAVGGFDEVNFIPGAVTFLILGSLHFAFDRLVRKDLVFLLGIFLSVAAFPALVFGILQDANVSPDVWALVFIAGALLLPYAMRVAAKIDAGRENLRKSFDPLTAFLVLTTMFITSFGGFGIIWLGLLILSVFGLFYLSIVMQNKHLLGNASFFLVVAVLEVSFKYFSGAGASVSLLVAAMGLMGSAAIATSINRKYFNLTAKG